MLYGIRPEDFHLGGEEDGWRLTVELVEMTGREIEIYGTIDGVRICTLLRERQRLSPGDTIWLKPDSARAHLFRPIRASVWQAEPGFCRRAAQGNSSVSISGCVAAL